MSPRIALVASLGLLLFPFTSGCEDDGDRPPGAGDAGAPSDGGPALTPGSNVGAVVETAGVGADGRPFAELRLYDAAGAPIPIEGWETRWTLAVFTPDPATGASAWTSLIFRDAMGPFGTTQQPATETGEVFEDLGDGRFRYTYQTALPAGYDPNATYRIAGWLDRTVAEERQIANFAFDFVPAGGAPAAVDVVTTETCNACHGVLQAHGGARREVKLCVTCHTPQLFDPDSEDTAVPGRMNPLDMATMVHRIHRGADLPTLVAAAEAGIVGAKYNVFGFRGTEFVFGETVADGPDADALPDRRGVEFPQDLRNCTTCHRGAPQAAHWQTVVAIRPCGSCHDSTWFGDPAATPPLHQPHAGGPVTDDRACVTCHQPTGGEFDLSVAGAHTVPRQSRSLEGLSFEIVSVQGMAGGNPTVVFRVTNANGTVVPLDQLQIIALTVGGPTREYSYQNVVRQDPRMGATLGADGNYTYTFAPRGPQDPWFPGGPVIPAGATGTFAVSIEGRRPVMLAASVEFEEAGFNPVAYFAVDGTAEPEPRREVVELAKCDACHAELRAHGNLRRNPEYCVMCHTFDASDWGQRPKVGQSVDLAATADGIEERSIRFSRMIHLIHTGDELEVTRPYTIYGFMGTLFELDHVRFPGNRANCTTCHIETTFTLEDAEARPATLVNETATLFHRGSPAHQPGEPAIPAIQSVCLSCHDSPAAHAHVELQTTMAGAEACAVCHGEGRDQAVTRVHAQ